MFVASQGLQPTRPPDQIPTSASAYSYHSNVPPPSSAPTQPPLNQPHAAMPPPPLGLPQGSQAVPPPNSAPPAMPPPGQQFAPGPPSTAQHPGKNVRARDVFPFYVGTSPCLSFYQFFYFHKQE